MTDFIQFAHERGLIINSIVRGKWARVPTVTHPTSRNGAYFFEDTYAHVQNWSIMDSPETWQDNQPRTPFEQEALRKRIETSHRLQLAERNRVREEAARKARWILTQCALEKHAYLDSHGMKDDLGLVWHRGEDNLLCVPMKVNDAVCGVQLINRAGDKKFLTGQQCKNASFTIGGGRHNIYCEGYATAKAIYAACAAFRLSVKVHACFSAGNLLNVAKNGFVIADNDASGTGERVTKESGLPYFMPPTQGDDFCDMWMSMGSLKSGMILQKLLLS